MTYFCCSCEEQLRDHEQSLEAHKPDAFRAVELIELLRRLSEAPKELKNRSDVQGCASNPTP